MQLAFDPFDFLHPHRLTSGASGPEDLLAGAAAPLPAGAAAPAATPAEQDQPDSLTGLVADDFSLLEGARDAQLDPVSDVVPSDPLATRSELFTYIVTVDTAESPLADRAREVLGSVRPQALFSNLGMVTVRLTAAQAQALVRRPGVLAVEQDQVVTLVLPENRQSGSLNAQSGSVSTSSSSDMLDWGVQRVWGGQDRRGSLPTSFMARVFVLDTGISGSTKDLIYNTTISRDFTGSRRSGFYDRNGHGTHVAGTIAAQANSVGVAGVAPGAEVVSLKVLGDQGSGAISGIINAINYMMTVAKKGDVANLSLGTGLSASLNDAVRKAAAEKGILFALAAGNETADVDGRSPASAGDASRGIFTVSAHDSNLKNAYFTNYDNFSGTDVDNVAFAAPGVNIASLKIDGAITTMSGTSMAAPHVAGLLVLGGANAFLATAGSAAAYRAETTDPLAVWSGTLA